MTMQFFVEEFNSIRSSGTVTVSNLSSSQFPHINRCQDDSTSSLRRQPSFQWAQSPKPQKSPTKADVAESPHSSPQRAEHDISNYSRNCGSSSLASISNTAEKSKAFQGVADTPSSGLGPPKPGRPENSDTFKSFKVSLEDPTWKVLPAALKKYRINNDNWQNYAMFICYGSPSKLRFV